MADPRPAGRRTLDAARLRRFARRGRRGRDHLGTHLDLLTPQERQVAAAVADGASNREVARQLFLSEKTVEYHLSNVYRKLQLRSRGQLRDHL